MNTRNTTMLARLTDRLTDAWTIAVMVGAPLYAFWVIQQLPVL